MLCLLHTHQRERERREQALIVGGMCGAWVERLTSCRLSPRAADASHSHGPPHLSNSICPAPHNTFKPIIIAMLNFCTVMLCASGLASGVLSSPGKIGYDEPMEAARYAKHCLQKRINLHTQYVILTHTAGCWHYESLCTDLSLVRVTLVA
jgi:hypothetical protein